MWRCRQDVMRAVAPVAECQQGHSDKEPHARQLPSESRQTGRDTQGQWQEASFGNTYRGRPHGATSHQPSSDSHL